MAADRAAMALLALLEPVRSGDGDGHAARGSETALEKSGLDGEVGADVAFAGIDVDVDHEQERFADAGEGEVLTDVTHVV